MLFFAYRVYSFIFTDILLILCIKKVHLIYPENASVSNGIHNDNTHLSFVESRHKLNLNIKFGEISGLSFDKHGKLHIFHRGNRVWNQDTFTRYDVYNQQNLGPISHATVLIIDPSNGDVTYKWGADRFYLPHGITVDHDDNVWLTDVALHQVFKFPSFPKDPYDNALLTLGKPFEPGRTNNMFCKPTAVAVLLTGEFFVADGYCNSRIIKYTANGVHLMEFGRSSSFDHFGPYFLNIPHGLTVAEDKNLLCVADRENARIQCFNVRNGSYAYEIQSPRQGSTIYDLDYLPINGGLFYVINGMSTLNDHYVYGYVISSISRKVITEFHPNGHNFTTPHTIAVSRDGSSVYVGQLEPTKLWKFDLDDSSMTRAEFIAERTEQKLPADNSLLDILKNTPFTGENMGTIMLAIIITIAVLLFALAFLSFVIICSKTKSQGRSNSTENLIFEK